MRKLDITVENFNISTFLDYQETYVTFKFDDLPEWDRTFNDPIETRLFIFHVLSELAINCDLTSEEIDNFLNLLWTLWTTKT